MSIRIDNQVTNQLNVPIMLANNYINRPTAGIFGRLFISNDTYQIFQDRVSGWSLIADAGSGSSNLEQVTQNGNTTTIGIYVIGSGTLSVQSLTNGSVLFPAGGSGQISQDNANFFWDNTNKRLGLGTASPGQRLDVHSSTGVTAQFNGTGVTNATLQLQNAGTSKWTIGNYYNSGNNDFNIYDNVNTTYRAYFTNTGYAIFPSNVIIGSTNRSSSYGLDVYSSAYFRSSIYNLNYTQGSILFAGSGGLINQNNSQFFWDNTNNRLGIGTASPSYALDVNGTTRFSGLITGTSGATISGVGGANPLLLTNTDYNTGTSTGSAMRLRLGSASGNTYSDIQAIMTGGGTLGILALNPSGGNVLIGTTTSAGYKFQVDGGGAYSMYINQTGGTAGFVPLTINHNVTSGTISLVSFVVGGVTGVGSITTNGATTSYNITSDYRLKQDFKNYSGLNLVSAIKTYDYEWKADKTRMYGVIAHELQEVIPYAVTEEKDAEQMQGVDYSKLVPILVKAIQELNEKLVRNNIN
jgi:hypothetical protein